MLENIRPRKKYTLKAQMLISYIVIAVVLLLTFSYVLFKLVTKTTLAEVQKVTEHMLYQVDQVAELELDNTFFYFREMYDKDTITVKALYNQPLDALERYEVYKRLNESLFANPMVHSIFLYNKKADVIYSSMSYEMPSEIFYDQEIISILKRYDFSYNNGLEVQCIDRKIKNNMLDKTPNLSVVTLIITDRRATTMERALIINIDKRNLNRVIFDERQETTGDITILNNQNKIITSSGGKTTDKVVKAYEKDPIRGDKGNFNSHIEGEWHTIYYVKNNKWQLTYLYMDTRANMLTQLDELSKQILMILGVFILGAIVVAVYSTKYIYYPMKKLLHQLTQINALDEQYNQNEIHSIQLAVDKMRYKIDKLEKYSDVQYMEQEALKSLFFDNVKPKKIEKFKQLLNINSAFYRVVYIRIDQAYRYEESALHLYSFIVKNILNDISIGNHLHYYQLEKENLIILTQGYEVEAIKEDLVKVQSYVMDKFNFTFSGAIGNEVTSLEKVRESYFNASQKIEYRLLYREACILTYNPQTDDEKKPYVYPDEFEKKIIDGIKHPQMENVEHYLKLFFDTISSYYYEEMLLAINQLCVILVQKMKQYVNINELGISYKYIMQNIQKLETLESMLDYLLSIIGHVNAHRQRQNDLKQTHLIEDICTYIKDNYQNKDLTIDEIAYRAKLSPNYVRKLFKDSRHQSLSKYILELRFEQAKKLLKDTQYPVKKIASMVGFSHSTYFSTAFKKKTGLSPEQYRK